MTPKKGMLLTLTLLILASLACSLLPPRTPTPTPEPGLSVEDVVATSVAATIIAGGGEAPTAEPAPSTEESAPPTEDPAPAPSSFLQIAYVLDGDIWYWEEGGVPAQLTTSGDVVSVYLSDDAMVAAFIRQYDWNNQEIYAVNTDGTNVRSLVTLADFATMVIGRDMISAVPSQIAWAPSTHTLSFNTRMTFEGPGLFLGDDIRQVDADTGVISVLMTPGTAGDFYYSPDGSQIAITDEDSISVVDADGTNRLDLLTFPIVITYSEYNYYPPVSWSPDSSYLRGAIPAADPLASPPDPTTIWHLPADGSPASTLTTVPTVPFFQNAIRFSPDTTQIVYFTEVTPGAPPVLDLHLANADGSGDVVYVSGDLRFHGWSTDGINFIYSNSGHTPRVGQLGDTPTFLPGISFLGGVSWVDETRFLYSNNPGAGWELWLRELGSPGTLLVSTTGDSIRYDFVK